MRFSRQKRRHFHIKTNSSDTRLANWENETGKTTKDNLKTKTGNPSPRLNSGLVNYRNSSQGPRKVRVFWGDLYACISRVCFCHLWTCRWLYLYFYTELTLLWWYSLICLATAKKACKKTRQQSCYQIKCLQEKQNQNQTIKIAVLQSTSQTSRASRAVDFYVSVAKVSESAGARPSSWDQLPEPEMRSEGLWESLGSNEKCISHVLILLQMTENNRFSLLVLVVPFALALLRISNCF